MQAVLDPTELRFQTKAQRVGCEPGQAPAPVGGRCVCASLPVGRGQRFDHRPAARQL
jgi:hypothetical protein